MIRQVLGSSGVLLGILLLVALFSLTSPVFFDWQNFLNIGQQSTILAVAAFAMTFVIIAGEIDLGIGAVASLIGILAALAMRAGYPMAVAVTIALLAGAAIGSLNGVLTVVGRVPSFIVTLGVFSIARGIAYTLTNARAVSVTDASFLTLFANGAPLGLPATVWFALLTFLGLQFLLANSVFGASVYAVGGNANAAAFSGLPVNAIKIKVFVLAGLLTALTALLLTARIGTGFVEGARNLELDAIAAVVLGGTSFAGGRGALWRTLLGALLIGILNNGMSLLNVESYYQIVIKGVIIVAAVLLDRWVTNRS